ncbi:MAG: hypothetical protein ABJZ62_09080 [Hyphomicrobiales bacterium]
MKSVTIEGRVLPERRSVTIAGLKTISYSDPQGFNAEFDIEISDSKIRIECSIPEKSNWHLQMCIVRAFEFATAAVDLYAFSKGWALDVILDDYVVAGQKQGIAVSETSVASLCTVISNEDDFLEIWEYLISNLNLKLAFRDLISSLSTLNYSAVAACRALECIRNSIAPDGTKDSDRWEFLRKKLQIERAYIQYITDAAREPRHGNRGAAFGDEQLEITHRIWKIMNRYIEFLKRGENEILPKDEFPLLK